jgi:ribosomal protein S12 methylthiotransferase accessory factor
MDPRCGILGEPEPLPFPAGYEGQMYGFSATVGRPSALHPGQMNTASDLTGYGTAGDETLARVRACCEALERYCATMYPVSDVLVATADELGADALDPRRLPQCSTRERLSADPAHRLRQPDSTAKERWIKGYSLTRGKEAWIPLSAAYLGLPDPLTHLTVFPESTGFAAGPSYDFAILSALCEAIERDSLAIWWLHQLPMPRLELGDAMEPALAEMIGRAQAVGLATHLFDLTTDLGVPVVGLIQTSTRDRPHAVVMGACKTTGTAAALRVVEEAASLRFALRGSTRGVGEDVIRRDGPCSPMDFGELYADDGAQERFAFATRDAPTQSHFPDTIEGADPLGALVQRLAAKDVEVFVVDVTMPEVRRAGIVVVRVIVPELMRISFSHGIRYLAHPRLYAAPERLAYGRRTEDMVTDDPIPFA